MSAILVPLDGSQLAYRALAFAKAIGQRAGRPLLLLRAVSTLACPTEASALAVRREAEAQLASDADLVKDAGQTVETCVVDEEPASAILDTIAERKIGLLVMSTHGRGGLGRWLYGSVADAVLRRSPIPILLIPPVGLEAWDFERRVTVLVPLDGSPVAEAAIQPACELADTLGASLFLVRSVPFSQYAAYAEGYVFADAAQTEQELAIAREYLDEVAERLRTDARPVETRATYGSPFLDVATLARDVGAQVIAMATHGRGGMKRALLGSVATSTVRRADVPLLLVRPSLTENAAERPGAAPATSVPEAEVRVSVTPDELELLIHTLGDRFHNEAVDPRRAEPARRLLEKLRNVRPSHGERRPVASRGPVKVTPV